LAALACLLLFVSPRYASGPREALLGMGTGAPVFRDLDIETPRLPIERRTASGRIISGAPTKHRTSAWRMGSTTAAPSRGRRRIRVHGPSKEFGRQQQVNLDENDIQKRYWAAAGVRGAALGEVPAAQIDHYVEEAAADCGSDPKCVCDWGGEPRKCLFAYCCGTIAHRLGEGRGDYRTSLPSVADRVEADFETRHLAAWQRICRPEQTFFDKQCAREALPKGDVRKND